MSVDQAAARARAVTPTGNALAVGRRPGEDGGVDLRLADDCEGHATLRALAWSVKSRDARPSDEDLSAQVPSLLAALSYRPVGAGYKRTQPGMEAAQVLLFALRNCSGPWLADLSAALRRTEAGGNELARQWASWALTREAYRAADWDGVHARCTSPAASVRLGAQLALRVEIGDAHRVRTRQLVPAIEDAIAGLHATGRKSGDATPFRRPDTTPPPPAFDVAPLVAPLRAGLRDSRVDVRETATHAVRDLAYWLHVDPTPFAVDLAALLRDRNTAVLKLAAEVVGLLPGRREDLADLVIGLLGHANGKVREQAMHALWRAKFPGLVPILLARLPDWLATDDRATALELGFIVRRLAHEGVDIGDVVTAIAARLGRYGKVTDKVYTEALVAFGAVDADRRAFVAKAVRASAPAASARSILKQLDAAGAA
jgi:hypothetical protein